MKTALTSLLLAAALALSNFAEAATVLVTGANRGLGYEFARQYAVDGWTVIATARSLQSAGELKALAAAHPKVRLEALDITDQKSIAALAQRLAGQPIDVLINNAGVLGDLDGQTLGTFKYDTFRDVMMVNTYGALALSEALLKNVLASEQKKIVAVTSGAGIVSRAQQGGKIYFYSASKVALNIVMRGLANDLKSQGVLVGLVAPSAVDTDMRRELVGDRASQDLRPEVSIAGMRKVIAGLGASNSGIPLNYDGQPLPW